MGTGKRLSWFAAFKVGLISLGLTAVASPASAVTIGETAPGAPPNTCDGGVDVVTPDAGTGNGYVVPTTGGIGAWTLTSWRTNASSETGQAMALKIFRKVADPATYQAVGHDVRHDLIPGLNTFAASLQLKAGDLLGVHFDAPTNGGACIFAAPGRTDFVPADLADGASDAFRQVPDFRLNVAAEVSPTSTFTLGKLRAKPNGTATLAVTVPNPGTLTVGGKGVKSSAARAAGNKQVGAGQAKVVIRAKGKKKRALMTNDKVTVKPKIRFTPTGGTPSTESRKVRLHRR